MDLIKGVRDMLKETGDALDVTMEKEGDGNFNECLLIVSKFWSKYEKLMDAINDDMRKVRIEGLTEEKKKLRVVNIEGFDMNGLLRLLEQLNRINILKWPVVEQNLAEGNVKGLIDVYQDNYNELYVDGTWAEQPTDKQVSAFTELIKLLTQFQTETEKQMTDKLVNNVVDDTMRGIEAAGDGY
jgi:hypothetical protein